MALRTLKGEKLEAERARLALMREYEDTYAACSAICGIDEAGRGPLAGPVVAGAAILPVDCEILFLNDSKKLSEKRREALFEEIKEKAVAWSVGIVGPDVIDEINILQATYEAMRQAIAALPVQPDLLLNDAVTIPEYGFAKHKGYGTAAHIAALKEFGPTPIHRRTFIKNFV